MRILTIILASLLGYVNPFVGTDWNGHTFPGAAYPFGMVQLSPDTRPRAGDWDGCSGYHYRDSVIYGFSHTHLSGTGCDDLCDILLMPAVGLNSPDISPDDYKSGFSHSREKASPGFYEVFLDKPQVLAQFTVGERFGVHRYVFPNGVAPQIVLDLRHRDHITDYSIKVESNSISGHRTSSSWAVNQNVAFSIYFSRDVHFKQEVDGAVVVTFKPKKKDNVLIVYTGISSTNENQAAINLREGVPEGGFDSVRLMAEREWENYLSTLDCPLEDEGSKKIFYTALYHTAIHPSLYSDVAGSYRGLNGKTYLVDDHDRYTVFSLWDTFRGLHPLICEISPELALSFIKSFMDIFLEGGKLPVWELWGYETNCMIGYHSAPVIADALVRGIDGFDVNMALYMLIETANKPEFGMESFRKNGVVLADDEHESVSKTLEYAYDDWCVAQVADWLLNHPDRSTIKEEDLLDIKEKFLESSQYWRNVFDPSTGFARPRLNGRWLTPFEPREVNNHFTEGNSWQYSFFVPHDVVGLMRAMGGPTKFVAKIDSLFAAPSQTTGRTQADLTGMLGQYAHGNEPSHHIPYLYALAGRPDKTEAAVRRIMNSLYSSRPDGLCGNDDCGQLSAWYVLSALDLYPVCPGAPLGKLTYVPKTIVVNPVFEMDADIFEDSLTVSVTNIDIGCRAFYRIGDGEFVPYREPFTVTESCRLECYSENIYGRKSFVTASEVRKVRNDIDITLGAEYNRQYNAGGPQGLVDGLRGKLNWRTGGWQGYQGTDFSAVIDLREIKSITQIGAGFCQDARSWIWMPRYVEFYASNDGEHFKKLIHIDNMVGEQDMEVQTLDFIADITGEKDIKARFVKVFAKNFGTIPDWHPGAGGEGFIFIDEFWVK